MISLFFIFIGGILWFIDFVILMFTEGRSSAILQKAGLAIALFGIFLAIFGL